MSLAEYADAILSAFLHLLSPKQRLQFECFYMMSWTAITLLYLYMYFRELIFSVIGDST